ncbi:MAG: hypothetical protein HC788_13540 [Sphingopyxis sp.]|nr:hypothetical protein [Sphingopyxis sp.]
MTAPLPRSSAAQAARSILTRQNEVMGARTNAQAKLNQVMQVIGECLNSENSGDTRIPGTLY